MKILQIIMDLTSNVHLLGERKDVADVTASLDIACSSSAYGGVFRM
jgi:hypothetical protein